MTPQKTLLHLSKCTNILKYGGRTATAKWSSRSGSVLNAKHSAGPSQWRRARLKSKALELPSCLHLARGPDFWACGVGRPHQEDETLNVSGWNEICGSASKTRLGEERLLLPVKKCFLLLQWSGHWTRIPAGCSFLGQIKLGRERERVWTLLED